MKNKKIISSWNKISLDKAADQQLLNSIMEFKRSYYLKDKVIYMKKSNGILWRISAVCACLALIIGGSIVYYVGENSENFSQSVGQLANSFTVMANAEEITGNAQVVIGELKGTGAGFGTSDDGNIMVRKYIEFPVRCEGNDIESVTYSLKNNNDKMQLYFVLNPEFEVMTENDGTDNLADKTIYIPETIVAEEYTVPYEFQPTEEQFGTVKNHTKADPVILSIGFNDRPEAIGNKDVDELLDELHDDNISDFFSEMMTNLMDMHHDEMQIEVTAHFADGTAQTKTLQLSCEPANYSEDFTLVQITGTLIQTDTQTADTPVIR